MFKLLHDQLRMHEFVFRFILVFIIELLIVTSAAAQKNLQPGYVITSGSDTLKGLIDYRNWEKNPDKIDFYTSSESVATQYTPEQIKSFTVSGEYYSSAIVKMDDSPYRTEDLEEGIKYNYVSDTVFLLNLVSGDKSLFSYMDINGKTHFYLPKGAGFELLIYKRYLRRDETTGDLKAAQIITYSGQLKLYLQECSTISSKFSELKYERKSLVDLFQYYYSCSKKKMVSQNKAVSKSHEFGVLAGVSFTKLTYLDGMDYLKNANFPVSTNASFGVFYNILFPRNLGKVSISNELFYYAFKSTCHYNEGTTMVNTSIGLNYIMMHNMFQYKLPISGFNCFFKGGTSFGVGFGETNTQKFIETSTQRPSEGKAFDKLNKAYLGVTAGAGFKIQKFTVQGRYMLGLNKSDFTLSLTAVNSRTNATFLMVGYEF